MSEITSVDRVFDSSLERYDQEKFKSSLSLDPQYVHHHEEMKERVKALPEKRITWIRDSEDGIFSIHSVDSATLIKSVSDAYRQHRSLICQNAQKAHEWACKKILMSLGVIGIALGAVAVFMPQAKIAAGVAGVVLAGIGAHYYFDKESKAHDAEKQAQLWSKPSTFAQEVANRRKTAYEGGFPYVYSKNLKSEGFLHPLEIKGLYEEYLSEFCKKQDPKRQLNWMSSFLSMNPLSSSLIKYGLGEIPDHLQAISQDFENFKALIDSIKNSYEAKKRELNGQTNSQILSYERQKRQGLDACLSTLQAEIAQAKGKRDVAVNLHHPLPCSDCNKADQTYQKTKKHYEDDYTNRMASLNTHLDNKGKKAIEAERVKLKGLSEEDIQRAQTKTQTLIQSYEEEKAQKLKEVHSLVVAVIDTEFNRKFQAIYALEKQKLKGLSNDAISEIEKETDRLIQSYDQEEEKTLNQLHNSAQKIIANAEAKRNETFRVYPDETSPEHLKAEENYQREKQHQEKIYSLNVAAVNTEFDDKVQAAHDLEKEKLGGLSRKDIFQIKNETIPQLKACEKEKTKALEERQQQSVAAIHSDFESKLQKAHDLEKTNLKGLSMSQILQIKKDTREQIRAIEEERAQALKPHLDQIEKEIAKAKGSRDVVFKTHPHQQNCPDCNKVDQTYQHEKKHHEEVHAKKAALINSHFTTQRTEALAANNESLNKLATEELHETLKHFDVAKEILFKAASTYK